MIGVLTIQLHLPTCNSLKAKRGQIKALMARLRREFNVSVAEMDKQDAWQEAVICCAAVSNSAAQLQQLLQTVAKWVHAHWPDGMVVDDHIEVI